MAPSSEEDGFPGRPRPPFAPCDPPDTSDSDRDLPSPPRRTPRPHRRRSQLAPDDPRHPPSAYSFPDTLPAVSRRGSVESVRIAARARIHDLPLPQPPFLVDAPCRSSAGSVSSSTLYRTSAAPPADPATSPRASSAATFRPPFLSPASRPSSTWSPPHGAVLFHAPSNTNSVAAFPAQKKAIASTRLRDKLTDEDKPWLARSKPLSERASRWITFGLLLVGVIVAAVLVFRGYQSVRVLRNSQLCIVLDDHFSGSSLDTSTWSLDVELGGYGNGEFEMTTDSSNNVYISSGQLYIMPTLTSDSISGGYSSVMDNGTYTLDGCTASNSSTAAQDAWVRPFQKRQNTAGNGDGTATNDGGNGGTTNNGGGTDNGGTTDNGGGTTVNNSTGNGYGGGTVSGGTNSTNSTTPSNSTSTGGGGSPCTAISSAQVGTVINPVMSGRINTRGKKSIKYGKVEVRAKLPQGDWLWPAIWMLPEGNDTSGPQGTGVYGPWPVSGEIDIMEARGNRPSYPAQGSNYVRSTMNYGPFPSGSTPVSTSSNSVTATLLKSLYGWVNTKRGNFASDFHVYGLEWTDSWMRFYMDSRLQATINLRISSKNTDSYFFNVADFPKVAMNMSSGTYIELGDPWSTAYGGTAAAPFDQKFYLVIDLAAGGTSGWFPDGIGGKPWYDGSATAMRDFASAQGTWSKTWPSNADNRAFRIDYVKMWQLCH